ncbi:hypothetical protein GCM10010156_72780 [Planobispora rosea]|uniref:Uncharacterized protein n=1 Tax=Planobispora rosea TaxID=35762 RepID=A0A8J3WGV1_PLARO|nr:hypothetical protein [Planobispora rosea]GGT04430.1 hypothetical protein GCM10010156_72780 [Planobispora rosea]GIH88910.1 hypothetical protein Pro02_73180 [Planobispora rosea]
MAARRNPKKNKAARRCRPERNAVSSSRRAQMSLETVTTLMLNAPGGVAVTAAQLRELGLTP